jgi:hypothetical protein
MADVITYWLGAREHLTITLADNGTPITDYEVAFLPVGTPISGATWAPATTYDGDTGAWVDDLPVGLYRVIARTGDDTPNELAIQDVDYVNIRSR